MTVLETAAHRSLERAYHLVGRWRPRQLFERYAARCRRAGIDRLFLIVSFDCDTPEDLDVVETVCKRLERLGIPPVLAIPGALMRRYADTCQQLATTGVEFLNHGDVQHTVFDQGLGGYRSSYFYDQLSNDEIRQDIVGGDTAVREVTGHQAAGFRAPHFGTYQSPQQLRYLHSILRELGYVVSSSTMPLYGLRYGPVFNRFGLWEVPVAGMGSAPTSVLDSWSCFSAPGRRLTPDDYVREGIALLGHLSQAGCGIINCYADPIHIHADERFFDMVSMWSAVAQALTYTQLITQVTMVHA
jgi:hypothetical protein